jgi:pilus assembly protein CpaF
MPSPLTVIAEHVRDRVRRDGVDLASDPALATRYVFDEVRRYSERALGGSVPLLDDEADATRRVLATLTGFGALQPLLDDPDIEEVWINAPDAVFVARDGRSERANIRFTEVEVRDLVERMLQSSGRRVDVSSPFVDASLPDGSRLHVAIPDVTRSWSVNVRKFSRSVRDLAQLVALGTVSAAAAEFLRMCVIAGLNILVSGPTHSGKTTMLGALLASAPENERVVTVEETFELALSVRDWVAMQCRQPSLEGTGEITLRRLIKEALRMRPDRLIVGEVREAEALDLLIALNSGLPGMSSIHANSARDALAKLAILPLLAGRNIDASFVVPTVAACVDLVVHCELDRDGHRRVTEIAALTGDTLAAASIFERRGGDLEPTGASPGRAEKFVRAGLDPEEVLRR